MIKSYKNKALKRLAEKADVSGLNPHHVKRIGHILNALEAAKNASDMNRPGFKFHALHGDEQGRYAVTVSGNWRVTFEFDGDTHAVD